MHRASRTLRSVAAPCKDGGAPVVVGIHGMGGVGKSALAIKAASQRADQFPDGHIYVNLQGATPGLEPVDPLNALSRMLRSLSVDPAAIPLEVDEASALWRSLVADWRLLLVLDNARSAEQVRPLLPASPTCAVLITSREVLTTLASTYSLHLALLPQERAVELLAELSGHERVSAEPAAAREVVRLCGRLPLAVQIVGARLAARPTWPISDLAARLADASRRLEELTVEGVGIGAAFDVSLEALAYSTDPIDQAAAIAFGLLGAPDNPDLDVGTAARLLDQSEPTSQTLLDRLVDAQLLETSRPGHYRFHDLVRLHARQHAATTRAELERVAGPAWVQSHARTIAPGLELPLGDVERPSGAEPVHRCIIAIDIEGYGRADHVDRDRLRLRADLRTLLDEAFASRAIPVDARSLVDVGDGLVVVVDSVVAKTRLVETLVVDLTRRLADRNLGRAQRARLRLRVAVHAGELLCDQHGYAGDAMVTAVGLLDAEVLRASLALTDSDLAVAVTDPIYRSVIEPGYTAVGPASYRPVQVRAGSSDLQAWLYVPETSTFPPPPPRSPADPVPEPADSHCRSVFLADIEGYSERPNAVKGRLRDQLYRLVTEAINATGITPDQYDPPRDQGDGLLVLFGPNVAKNRLLHPLIPHLADGLIGYNTGVPKRERMRLRVVVDAGDLRRDDRGYYGTDLDEAFGLVNAEELRACLAQTTSPLVVAVSREVYDGIVRHEYDGIDPATFCPIMVRLKQRDLEAWVHYPRL